MSNLDFSVVSHANEIMLMLKSQAARGMKSVGDTAEGYVKLLTPVDTGTLRDSIDNIVTSDNTVVIGTNVKYARAVEFGDNMNFKHDKNPAAQAHYLRDGVSSHRDEYQRILESYLRH